MIKRIKKNNLWQVFYLVGMALGDVVGAAVAKQISDKEIIWYFFLFVFAPILAELTAIVQRRNRGGNSQRVLLVSLGMLIAYLIYFLPFTFGKMSVSEVSVTEVWLMFIVVVQIVISLFIGFIISLFQKTKNV